MLPITSRNYSPVSREEHYAKMRAFINSMKGLPPGKYSYKHYFSDGVYIREMTLKKGTVIAGAVHKRETAMAMLKGSMKIFTEDGLKLVKAPAITITPPGTQRAGVALEDTVIITIHRADTYDLDEMISELVEGSLEDLSGLREGNYKLYIHGRKLIDEEIHSDSDKLAIRGHLQRILPSRD